MNQTVDIISAINDDRDFGKCKCGKTASVKCYGGPEPGEYCWDCNMKMLYRINGMNQGESIKALQRRKTK